MTPRLFLITLAVGSALPTALQLSVEQQLKPLQDAAAAQPATRLATLAHQAAVRAQLALLQASIKLGVLEEKKVEPTCNPKPSRLADAAPHHKPAVPACAATCLQLRDEGGATEDGVYWLAGLPVPVYCDLSLDGGGWTLLLVAVSKPGWDALSVLNRNSHLPSLDDNYSILTYANNIRNLGTGKLFAYRIETQAQLGRQRWGGVWLAPRGYSFVHNKNTQTDVLLARQFNKWIYNDNGVEQRMPWVSFPLPTNDGIIKAVLTTSTLPNQSWWGTLVTHYRYSDFVHSPWIHPESPKSGTVLYWVREEVA